MFALMISLIRVNQGQNLDHHFRSVENLITTVYVVSFWSYHLEVENVCLDELLGEL